MKRSEYSPLKVQTNIAKKQYQGYSKTKFKDKIYELNETNKNEKKNST